MPDQFPDFRDGDPLEPWHLNIIYKELRRLRKLKAAPPLSVDGADGDEGPCIILWPEYTSTVFKTTSSISAMSGTAPGSGTGKFQEFDGTNFSDGPTGITLYSISEKVIASGSYVICAQWNGYWWVVTVDKCANLS